MPDFELEFSHAPNIVAGVDEVGRGPLAGPVVAAAVIFHDCSDIPDGIDDSKKIAKKDHELLYSQLIECCDYGIGIVDREIIDEINILQASKLAMQHALEALCSMRTRRQKDHPQVILVDGNQKIIFRQSEIITVIKGDSKSLSIAAASIIAKVTRDRIMSELHEEFPHYSWNSNSGYSTAAHLKAMAEHGVTTHHRRSFAPVRQYLPEYRDVAPLQQDFLTQKLEKKIYG